MFGHLPRPRRARPPPRLLGSGPVQRHDGAGDVPRMQMRPGDVGQVGRPDDPYAQVGHPAAGRREIRDLEYRHVSPVTAAPVEVPAGGRVRLSGRHHLHERVACREHRVGQAELSHARIVKGRRPAEGHAQLASHLAAVARHKRHLPQPRSAQHIPTIERALDDPRGAVSDLPVGGASMIEAERVALRRRYAQERDKRLRPDGNDQYLELKGQFSRLLEDPYTPRTERHPRHDHVTVAFVGGGFAGLVTGARLREAGVADVRIVEKGGGFGGTWYWNRYPGAQCDVESYIYLPLLEETGYVPTEKYVHAPEILEHCDRIADHFGLREGACLSTEVKGMEWDAA